MDEKQMQSLQTVMQEYVVQRNLLGDRAAQMSQELFLTKERLKEVEAELAAAKLEAVDQGGDDLNIPEAEVKH